MKRTLLVGLLVVALVGGLIAPAAAADQPAELHIEQPAYVDDDVSVTEDDGDRIYTVSGEEFLIRLENADHANVTDASVSDGTGSLDYDAAIDMFRYEPDGVGTMTLSFFVDEGDGIDTYEAIVQVEQVGFVTYSADRDEEIRAAADNWEDFEGEVNRIDQDLDAEEAASTGLTWVRFREAPFASFLEPIQAILIMMATTAGGWFLIGIFLGLTLLAVAGNARYRNRTQKQFGDIGDIQVEKDEAYLKKAERVAIQQVDLNEHFPDDVAHALRKHLGSNTWSALKQYMLIRPPVAVKATCLQLMGQAGYEGRVERGADGSIERAWVVDPDPGEARLGDDDDAVADGGTEAVDLTALRYQRDDDVAFIHAIDGDELDERVYHLDPEQIDFEQVQFPISNREVTDDEILEHINPRFPEEFENEAELAAAIAKLWEVAIEHEWTDEDGNPRREMDLVAFLAEMDSVLADKLDFPAGHLYRRETLYLAEHLSEADKLDEVIETMHKDGAGRLDGG